MSKFLSLGEAIKAVYHNAFYIYLNINFHLVSINWITKIDKIMYNTTTKIELIQHTS